MHVWQQIASKLNSKNWLIPAFFSLLLFLVVIYQIEPDKFMSVFREIRMPFIFSGILLLLLEGIFTSVRFRVLAAKKLELRNCFRMTAWYVLYLTILPARLGELVAIILAKNFFQMSTGVAAMNIIIQRVFDIAVLSAIFILVLIPVSLPINNIGLLFLALLLTLISIYIIAYLDRFLSLIIKIIKAPRKGRTRKLLRILLQARIWHRKKLTGKSALMTFIITLFKWLANLSGLAIVLYGMNLPLDHQTLIFVSIIFNFLTLIPLQTLGGFGISEAGLAGTLALFGIALPVAASTAVIARLFYLTAPVLFWFFVITVFRRNSSGGQTG